MTKILKTILLLLLAVLIAVQVPFVYRRYKIGAMAAQIDEINAGRVSRETEGFTEYKGVIHVHTFLGGHSTGTFEELVSAANANDLDFVAMTEHQEDTLDTAALTLNGTHGKTVFINGQEVDTNDGGRFLLLPGSAESPSFAKLDSRSFLNKIHSEGRIAINAYPDRNRSGVTGFDGIEAYSLHVNLKRANIAAAIGDIIWSLPSYPEETVATYLRPLDDYLATYDRISTTQRLLLAAGTDAHSNLGYYLFADDAGNKKFGIKLDPYETVFRIVRMHVLIESGTPVSRETVLEALRKGRAFAGFDVLGDTSGFRFMAEAVTTSADGSVQPPANPSDDDISRANRRIMGDDIALGDRVRLFGAVPAEARIVVLRDGVAVAEFPNALEFSLNVSEKGTYRVEVYLDRLGETFEWTPWIMSNPIYVR